MYASRENCDNEYCEKTMKLNSRDIQKQTES